MFFFLFSTRKYVEENFNDGKIEKMMKKKKLYFNEYGIIICSNEFFENKFKVLSMHSILFLHGKINMNKRNENMKQFIEAYSIHVLDRMCNNMNKNNMWHKYFLFSKCIFPIFTLKIFTYTIL